MSEACPRSIVRGFFWVLMAGMVAAGCMGSPQRSSSKGGQGLDEPDETDEPKPDASAPKPKADARQEDPPAPDALATAPDLGGSADAKSAGDTGSASGDAAPAAVTFTELWMTVFGTPMGQAQSCAGAACHNPGTKDMISFADKTRAYMSLTRTGGPVVKGNPSGSKLVQRLASTNVMQRMPLGKPPLSKDVVDKVRGWIAAGANND